MKTPLLFLLACGAICGETTTNAETVWDSADNDAAPQFRQRLGLSYRMNYNISTKFGNLGGFASGSRPGPPTGSAVDRTYDNGFNRVDISGNAGGQTWFWGYNSASQIVGDTVVMSSRSSSANVTSDASDDPQHGIELTYNLELGGRKKWRWGLEAAGNYTAVNVSDNRTLAGNVQTISDAFALNGIVPPMAPYAGTFTGPGPTIGSTPGRTVTFTSGGASISGERKIDADLFGVRLGPYLEIPVTKRLALTVSAGGALVGLSSDFKFNERVTITGGGTTRRSGESSDDSILFGGYVGGNVSFALTERWSIFTGVQYYSLGTHSQQANGKTADLDFGNSFALSFGGSVSF